MSNYIYNLIAVKCCDRHCEMIQSQDLDCHVETKISSFGDDVLIASDIEIQRNVLCVASHKENTKLT